MGATVNKQAYRNLANRVRRDAQKKGLDPQITPKSNQVLKRMDELGDADVAVSEIEGGDP